MLLRQLRLAASKLSKFQLNRINVLSQAISELNEEDQAVLWQLFRDKHQETIGLDPALFRDFAPKLQKHNEWPVLTPENFEILKNIKANMSFQGGFIDSVISGAFTMSASAASSAAQEEKVEEVKKVEEKTNFDVVVIGFSPEGKLKLIREVKNIMNIGLKEAKDKVEEIPVNHLIIGKALPTDQAQELSVKLKEIGCIVDLK